MAAAAEHIEQQIPHAHLIDVIEMNISFKNG